MVLDPHNRHVVQIEGDEDVLDRVGVAVIVIGTGADPDDAPRQATTFEVSLVVIDPERPGIDPDQVHVGDAAPVHRGLEIGILAHDLLAGEDLFQRERRLPCLDEVPAGDPALGQRDDRLDCAPFATVDQDRSRLARNIVSIP